MSKTGNYGQDKIIQVLSDALVQAQQGRIRSLILLTQGDSARNHWVQIFDDEDHAVALGQVNEAEQWLLENKPPQ